MKRTAILVLCAFLIGSGAALAQKVAHVEKPADVPSFVGYVQDEFVVILKDRVGAVSPRMAPDGIVEIGVPDFDAISRQFAVSGLRKQFPGAIDAVGSPTGRLARHYKIKFAQGSLENVMAAYGQHPMVERVEPIGIHTTFATPNDGWYGDQWHLNQANDADMDAPEAWDYETGDATVVVAIFDTGVRYFHKDLGGSNASYSNPTAVDGNMWINWVEKNGTAGVDDDGNGKVDDWVGWDFVDGGSNCWSGEDCDDQDNDPRDFNGHGTHCAGNVGAINNNGYATCAPSGGWGDGTLQPTANGVKVMACRIGWSGVYIIWEVGYVRMDFAAEAFYYAADNDARIVSCSWGSSNTGGIAAAIDYFLASGGMVFHAAGNDGNENQDYLASRSDIINVAATDTLDCKADFSNYGTWVDISAPGTDIWSSYHDHDDPAGDYVAPIDGTSMACPLAASVAALIWSQNLGWTAAQVETKLLESVDDIYALGCNSAYAGKLGSGRVNAFLAVSGGPPPPVAAFSGSPTSGCAALVVDFTDESTGDITSWSWTFGDGGTSAAQNPSYTYNDPGTYTVSLTVTGPGGSDTETKTGYITVNSAPTADFSGNPTGGTEPLTVDFTDLSAGNPTSWSWDFGDGGSSTQQNPSYTYNNAGTYTVTLTATNTCGSDGETKIDYITVDPCVPPTADFVGSPTNGTAPLTVDFTDLSTGNPTSWSWDFGDGGSSTQQNPSYTYNNAGTYTVTLTATNACGSDGEAKVDYITVDPPSNEKAFAQSDIPVKGTFSGNYANTHSSDNVYEIITEALSTSHPRKQTSEAEHKWDFNLGSGGSNMMFYAEAYRPDNSDGDDFIFEYSTDDVTYNSLFTVASGTEQVYSATLPAGLTGTVYVKVRDSNRSWDLILLDAVYIDQMYIEYETTPAPPVADFSGTPTSGNYPLTVNFTDLSTGSPTSWSWDFGDMGTSAAQNPSHTYTAVGKYTVSLAVTNAYGSDTETKIDYINVTEPGQDYSHVHDMAVGLIKVGPNNKGTCTVTIYDQNNTALAEATVYVSYDGPNSGTLNGVTGGDGTVYFESAPYKKPPVQWCFEVTNVTHGTHTYDAAANNVTRACENGWVYGDGPAARSAVDGQVPYTFGLSQNYPNPFNPITEISFTLPSACYAKLEVFNIVGQKVTMLIDRQMNAGEHTCVWDGSDAASGVYFYRLEAGSVVETRKMILMK